MTALVQAAQTQCPKLPSRAACARGVSEWIQATLVAKQVTCPPVCLHTVGGLACCRAAANCPTFSTLTSTA